MDLWRIAVRALGAYIYLLTMSRASGKRAVSQATPFDFVVSLIVGDLIDDALWAEVSMAKFAVAAASIFTCDVIVKVAAFHSKRILHLVNGRPRVVLRDGRELRDELRKEQLNEGDVAHLLRLQGIEKREDVRLGAIELDHQISVIRHPGAEPATKSMKEEALACMQRRNSSA